MKGVRSAWPPSFASRPLSVTLWATRLHRLAPIVATVVALTTLFVLGCWALAQERVYAMWPGLFAMKANTALGLLLLAFVTLGLARRDRLARITVWVGAGAVLALALFTLAEYANVTGFSIDQLFVDDRTSVRYPGRPSPVTAVGMVALAIASLLTDRRSHAVLTQALIFIACAAPLTAFCGYLYRTPSLDATTALPIPAVHTSVSQILLCAGVLFANPSGGLMRILVSDSLAGALARKLLPLSIVMPTVCGLVVSTGEEFGLFGVQFGAALLVSTCSLFFATAVWFTTSLLWHEEIVRQTEADHRAAAEFQLSEREDRLRIAIATARLGTWELDLIANEITGSAEFKAAFGQPAEAPFTYEALVATITPADRERMQEIRMSALANRIDYAADYRITWPDGSPHWVLASGRAEYDAAGRPVRMVGVTLDITERKRIEADREALLTRETQTRMEAERASSMKDEFLATLSHELRTPLNAILGWSQLLSRAGTKPETLAEGLATIERNAKAQRQIIQDLLDMSSIINGKSSVAMQRTDLAGIVRAAMSTVEPTAAAKQIGLSFINTQDTRRPILGDPNRLQQVFWNLMLNAIKFTPRGGFVTIHIDKAASQWSVDVVDTGEGISADFLPHVFDRFRQADASTTRRHGGLGLGLAIVKQLVEQHGGAVRAESGGRGMGATFTVQLPISVVQGEADPLDPIRKDRPADEKADFRDLPTPHDPTSTDSLSGLTLLVVDDEADARTLLKRLCEESGAEVLVAASVAEAIDILENVTPDALISDIGMPGADGYALVRKVRALESTTGRHMPAIALTAYAHLEDRAKALAAGFQRHITKPVEPVELITAVGDLLGRV